MPAKKVNSKKKQNINVSVNGNVTGNVIIGDENNASQTTFIQPETEEEKDVLFDVGYRLKRVREEIGISSSEFVEELGLLSQREFLEIENGKKEVPLSLLKQIHELTGVSLKWLMHGKGQRYEVAASDFKPIQMGLDLIARLKPRIVYFVLGYSAVAIQNLTTSIVVQTDKYRYQVIDYGMHLDFWNWEDQLGYIPLFYEFLSALWDRYYGPYGIFISTGYCKQLLEGKIHFQEAARHSNGKYFFWPNAVLDVDYKDQEKSFYERYYGKWITRVHNGFKEITTLISERKRQ